jgi:hypothetical protein
MLVADATAEISMNLTNTRQTELDRTYSVSLCIYVI